MRFFHTTDPAITRKRSIEESCAQERSKLKVESIEPIGKRQLFDITTGTGDFIANGVVSHNCFARNTHTYLDMNAGRDFEREIVVKVNVPELLRAELAKPSWKRELVAFGTNTDPYQWAEGRYELMPPMIEALRDAETPTSILTKSPLVTRDLDLSSSSPRSPTSRSTSPSRPSTRRSGGRQSRIRPIRASASRPSRPSTRPASPPASWSLL